jgi:hypothetical protein
MYKWFKQQRELGPDQEAIAPELACLLEVTNAVYNVTIQLFDEISSNSLSYIII